MEEPPVVVRRERQIWGIVGYFRINDVIKEAHKIGQGLIPLFPEIAGLVVWVLALTFSTVGFRLAAREST